MAVATIIVNYGTADLVCRHLPSVVAEAVTQKNPRIIIVDNASPGRDAAMLQDFVTRERLGDIVRVIAHDRNDGFAAGNNVGLMALREEGYEADAFFLLNPDAYPLEGCFQSLCGLLVERPRAAVAGARLENDDGSLRYSAFVFPSALGELLDKARVKALYELAGREIKSPDKADAAPSPVDWVSGAAFLVRASALDADSPVLMDESYFLYFEETDLMLSLRRQGFEIWHVPAARVVHYAGAATNIGHASAKPPRRPSYWFRSWVFYYVKNRGRTYSMLAVSAAAIGVALQMVISGLLRRPNGFPPRFLTDILTIALPMTWAPKSELKASRA